MTHYLRWHQVMIASTRHLAEHLCFYLDDNGRLYAIVGSTLVQTDQSYKQLNNAKLPPNAKDYYTLLVDNRMSIIVAVAFMENSAIVNVYSTKDLSEICNVKLNGAYVG